ncbi:MAG: hypothetical protein Q7S53_00575 [bacterium]|nr:hypothetical protein [bacterium]
MIAGMIVLGFLVVNYYLHRKNGRIFSKQLEFIKTNGDVEKWADDEEKCLTYLAFFKSQRKVDVLQMIICLVVAMVLYFSNIVEVGILYLLASLFYYGHYVVDGWGRSVAVEKIKKAGGLQAE